MPRSSRRLRSLSPGPQFETLFRVVNETGGIVMIHVRGGEATAQRRAQDMADLGTVIGRYPRVIFLFHEVNDVVVEELLPILAKYPNRVLHVQLVSHRRRGLGRSEDHLDRRLAGCDQRVDRPLQSRP